VEHLFPLESLFEDSIVLLEGQTIYQEKTMSLADLFPIEVDANSDIINSDYGHLSLVDVFYERDWVPLDDLLNGSLDVTLSNDQRGASYRFRYIDYTPE